jgi:hypothetical protein
VSAFEDALRQTVAAALAPLEGELRALRSELHQLAVAAVHTPAPDPDHFLPLPEAARVAGKHPDTLRRAIRQKRLKASKADGAREWSVRRGDLQEYLSPSAGRPRLDEERKIAQAVSRVRKTGRG